MGPSDTTESASTGSASWESGLDEAVSELNTAFRDEADPQGDGDDGSGAAADPAAPTEQPGTAPATPAADPAAPPADAPIAREDGAVWNAAAKRWQKGGAFVEGEAPANAPAAAAPVVPEAFKYRWHGAEHTADGWEQHADGSVRVPPDKVGQLRAALSSAREYSERVPQEKAELTQQVTQLRERAGREITAYAQLSNYLLDLVEEAYPSLEMGDEKLKLVRERAKLMLERGGIGPGAGAGNGRPPAPSGQPGQQPPTAAPRTEHVRQAALGQMTDAFHTRFLGPDAAAIPVGPERDALLASYSARVPIYIVDVQGQAYFNQDAFESDLARDITRAREVADLKAQLAAAKKNAGPAKPVAPRPPATRAPAARPAPAPGARPKRLDLDQFQREIAAELREA